MRAIAFDFETTGLTKHPMAPLRLQPRAIEFGAVLIEDDQIVDELSLLFYPGVKLEPIITKITGLTDDDLRGEKTFTECIPLMSEFFSRADIMVAHNLPFDTAILRYELQRASHEDFPWPQLALCTVQEHAETWGKRPKLLELYEETIGVPLMQTHRALDDCRALAEIYIKLGLGDVYAAAIASQD